MNCIVKEKKKKNLYDIKWYRKRLFLDCDRTQAREATFERAQSVNGNVIVYFT